MKERVSKLTYPTLQHFLRMLYTMNGTSKHLWRAIWQKRGHKLLLKRIKSAFPVKMHIYTIHYVLHYYKVSGNSVEWFQRSCANKLLSSIFHFGQISKFKKGVTPRKKMESKFPVDMHIYTLCPSYLQSFMKFCWAVSEELR